MSLESQVWQFFRGKGLGERATAALMGNAYQESNFDPNCVEFKDGGGGLGIFQETGERRTQMVAYGTSVECQLEFAWEEITLPYNTKGNTGAYGQWIEKSGYKTQADFLNDNGTVEELTLAFSKCWERPGIPRNEVRVSKAKEYFQQFTGTQVDNTMAGSSTNTVNSDSLYDNKLYRQLDKDGIYRIYKLTYTIDTRGNDFYVEVEAVSQVGGNIPILKN